MRKLIYSNASPFARKVRVVLAEKGLDYEGDASGHRGKPVAEIAKVNPNLVIPVFYDGDLTLFESNLILEYLLQTYPDTPASGAEPPLAPALTRPKHHWRDAKILATLETMAGAMVNLRHLTVDGVDARQAPYLGRHADRIQSCLDWLEEEATYEGFCPGLFSIQDLNLICHLEFASFRNIFPWHGRPRLEAIVALHGRRPALEATRPA